MANWDITTSKADTNHVKEKIVEEASKLKLLLTSCFLFCCIWLQDKCKTLTSTDFLEKLDCFLKNLGQNLNAVAISGHLNKNISPGQNSSEVRLFRLFK